VCNLATVSIVYAQHGMAVILRLTELWNSYQQSAVRTPLRLLWSSRQSRCYARFLQFFHKVTFLVKFNHDVTTTNKLSIYIYLWNCRPVWIIFYTWNWNTHMNVWLMVNRNSPFTTHWHYSTLTQLDTIWLHCQFPHTQLSLINFSSSLHCIPLDKREIDGHWYCEQLSWRICKVVMQ